MKIISIILSVMLLMVFLSNKRIDTNNNELQFKKWLVDTIPYVKDNFEIQDDSLTFIIEEHHKYEVANREEKESLRGYIISLLKEYSEPPFKDYELEIIKKTYFIPSEISSLVYDSWCEFPLIKVSNKNISISYEEIRGRINSAVIIDQITNDTTFVQWIYDNKGKIQKQTLSNVQKITSAIFLLQFMFRSIAKNLTKEPCKDVVFILMCSMYFIV